MIILGERYHKLALEMAEEETDETRKAELLHIAANLEVVPAHVSTDLLAGNPVILVHTPCKVTTELNPWDAFLRPGTYGSASDQILWRQYAEAGILDDERALELLECLWA